MRHTPIKLKAVTLAVMMASASTFASHAPGHNDPAAKPSAKAAVKAYTKKMQNDFDLLSFKLGTFKLDDFSITAKVNDPRVPILQLNIDDVSASDWAYDKATRQSSGSFDIGNISLLGMSADMKNKMDIFHIRGVQGKSSMDYGDTKNHPTGSVELKVNDFHFSNPDRVSKNQPQHIDVNKVELSGQVRTKGDRTMADGEVSFKSIQVDDFKIGPFEFKYDFNVDKNAYAEYLNFIRKLQKIGKLTQHQKLTDDQAKKIKGWAFQRGQKIAMDFAKTGVDFRIDKLSLVTPEGDIKGKANFHTDPMDGDKKPKITANVELSAPVVIVMKVLNMMNDKNVLKSKQMLNNWINQGFVVKKGKMLDFSADLKDGKLTINGKTLTVGLKDKSK